LALGGEGKRKKGVGGILVLAGGRGDREKNARKKKAGYRALLGIFVLKSPFLLSGRKESKGCVSAPRGAFKKKRGRPRLTPLHLLNAGKKGKGE